jgi:hypothetical protein
MVIVMVQGDAGSAIVFVAFALVLFRDGLGVLLTLLLEATVTSFSGAWPTVSEYVLALRVFWWRLPELLFISRGETKRQLNGLLHSW